MRETKHTNETKDLNAPTLQALGQVAWLATCLEDWTNKMRCPGYSGLSRISMHSGPDGITTLSYLAPFG